MNKVFRLKVFHHLIDFFTQIIQQNLPTRQFRRRNCVCRRIARANFAKVALDLILSRHVHLVLLVANCHAFASESSNLIPQLIVVACPLPQLHVCGHRRDISVSQATATQNAATTVVTTMTITKNDF